MNDFARMARVIRYLNDAFVEQPTLEELASAAGLSPWHFHRLFTKWVGVTPKDFVQCLTAEHAKRLLREGANVLDSALASGLSGPGRLHDLCVTLEAASPGEVKSGGRDLAIAFGFAPTPFGECLLAQSNRGICALAFVEPGGRGAAQSQLRIDWPAAQLTRSDPAAHAALQNIFTRVPGAPRPLRAFVRGTKFQLQVWRALLRLPPGFAISYRRLAAAIGNPRAARAVGTAVGANPLAWLIPCHRVIRETGALGNYRWGTGRKRALLAWESAARPASMLDVPGVRP